MINTGKTSTPQFIFIVYILAASILIMIFRFIFPGSEAPLLIYSMNWRLIQGLMEVFNLFPALAFSALVIPFGLAVFEEQYENFSEVLFKRLSASVITAIAAAIIYSLIFFLAFPIVKNHETNLRFSGALYNLAKTNAQESRDAGEWFEASQFLAICSRIWFNSPELAALRDEVAINLEVRISEERDGLFHTQTSPARDRHDFDFSPFSGEPQEVNAAEAIAMSRTAFDEERYYHAHWLANLGGRLAGRGSAEAANAARLASESWNMIASLAPNRAEIRLSELYNLKLSGYRAMESEEWVSAYYIFRELLTFTPDDPDVRNFLAVSEQAAKEIAFFTDELELSVGEILNGAVFSLPDRSGNSDGRAVLRFSNLTLSADIAYGFGFEYMKFDVNDNPQASVTSRYAKLLPFMLNEKPQILILTHALDRHNQDNSFPGEWLIGSPAPGGILLDVSFEDFLLISRVRRGLSSLQTGELFTAASKLEKAGYIHQIFQAEILNRLGSALFFLPVAIFVITIAWRYRAKQRPRYLFFLLLPVLPIVFNGFVFLYRSVFNALGIWLVLSIGFALALTVYIVMLAVSLFISLIVLSAQHS